MKFFKPHLENYQDENIFWASMSDLLLGLTIVFMVLFVLSVMGITKQKIEQENLKNKIVQQLSQEFAKADIPVEIDKRSGAIKISELELFKLNDWTISDKGKAYLNKVVPTYLGTILGNPEIKKNIAQIIIEGHSDSQSFKNLNKEQNYVKNLDLSVKRSLAVSSYIISINSSKKDKYKDDLMKLLSTTGRSFSDPVLVKGKEDYSKSRRVELKFQLRDYNFIDLLRKYKFK